jgi:hypothetical protein
VIAFVVKGRKVEVSEHLWEALEGPKPDPATFCVSDGCSKSPDTWTSILGRRFKLWPACIIHDYHYRTGVLGGTWSSRFRADAIFRRNIYQLVLMEGGSHAHAAMIAWIYWQGVRLGSSALFWWAPRRRPVGMVSRAREAMGLFLEPAGAYRPLSRPALE